MIINPTIKNVTDRITKRSETTRSDYLEKMNGARKEGPRRAHLTCGNQAHAYAPVPEDQKRLIDEAGGNIGIINAYNDMLSAHQPFEKYPEIIKKAARLVGGTAQLPEDFKVQYKFVDPDKVKSERREHKEIQEMTNTLKNIINQLQ